MVMPTITVETFKKEIAEIFKADQCAIVVGAGVTSSSVEGNVDCTWKGLLKSGLNRCQALNSLTPEWLNRKYKDLEEGDMFSLLSVAYEVEGRLKYPNLLAFKDWLENEIR